jgi:hypothetical protein
MSRSQQVFIYNGPHTAEYSVPDLKELLSSEVIFGSKPDVTLTTFDFNPQGLVDPTIVIPGGDTFSMKEGMQKALNTIQNRLHNRYNFIGVCAGALAAPCIAELFTLPKDQYGCIPFNESPIFSQSKSSDAGGFNLNRVYSWKALAPFYPNASFVGFTPRAYMPYITNVILANGKTLPQLFVAGPGFVSMSMSSQPGEHECKIAATYSDQRYKFFYPGRNETRDYALVDMLARRPSEELGGIFLSGTHLEACVPLSKKEGNIGIRLQNIPTISF